MQIAIENFLNDIKDPTKKKRFLKICFSTDLKAKQKNRFPNSFLILEHNFSQREVLFASKIYLDEYASQEEKDQYYQILDKYINSLSEHSKKLYSIYHKSFYAYLQYDISDENFYNLKKEFVCDVEELLEYPRRYDALYANFSERELYKNKKEEISIKTLKCKFYYEICKKIKWDLKPLYYLSLEFGKPIPYILNMANLYITEYLHEDSSVEISNLLNKYYSKINQTNRLKKVFEKLEMIEKEEEIISYLQSIQIKTTTLKRYLDDYLKTYKKSLSVGSFRDLRQSLIKKIEFYQEYLINLEEKTLRKDNSSKFNLIDIEKLIIEFLDGNYPSKEEFCQLKQIKVGELDEIIYQISQSNKDLYLNYCKHIQSSQNENAQNIINLIKEMINYIKYGINDEGMLRYFDILDYFTMTNLSFNKILNICKSNFNQVDYHLLLFFLNKNRGLNLITEKNLENILSEKNIVGVKFDTNNMPILGTGYEVTREKKLEIIENLKKQNIPLYYQVYKLALNRKFNIVHKRTK